MGLALAVQLWWPGFGGPALSTLVGFGGPAVVAQLWWPSFGGPILVANIDGPAAPPLALERQNGFGNYV